MCDIRFSPTEEVVLKLIQEDMKFIYNVIKDMEIRQKHNFTISFLYWLCKSRNY